MNISIDNPGHLMYIYIQINVLNHTLETASYDVSQGRVIKNMETFLQILKKE